MLKGQYGTWVRDKVSTYCDANVTFSVTASVLMEYAEKPSNTNNDRKMDSRHLTTP